jgi:hypothetical protein
VPIRTEIARGLAPRRGDRVERAEEGARHAAAKRAHDLAEVVRRDAIPVARGHLAERGHATESNCRSAVTAAPTGWEGVYRLTTARRRVARRDASRRAPTARRARIAARGGLCDTGGAMARPATLAPATPPVDRLSFGQKAVYGFGDVIVAMRQTVFQFYLLPFYTDVVVLAPWLAGLGKMLGFVWDGVNDPVTGYLSDRTRTRLGRRRPFMLGAALPLGLTFGLLWSPPTHLGPAAGFLYMVLAFVVLDTFFTLYATPYLALGAELSRDYHERTQISASRSFFHVLGLFAGGVIRA